ncbi:DUF4129 domain-containing protein [Thermosphaera sp.]
MKNLALIAMIALLTPVIVAGGVFPALQTVSFNNPIKHTPGFPEPLYDELIREIMSRLTSGNNAYYPPDMLIEKPVVTGSSDQQSSPNNQVQPPSISDIDIPESLPNPGSSLQDAFGNMPHPPLPTISTPSLLPTTSIPGLTGINPLLILLIPLVIAVALIAWYGGGLKTGLQRGITGIIGRIGGKTSMGGVVGEDPVSLYWAAVAHVSKTTGIVKMDPETHWEYFTRVKGSLNPPLQEFFKELTRIYELARYGHFNDPALSKQALDNYRGLVGRVEG